MAQEILNSVSQSAKSQGNVRTKSAGQALMNIFSSQTTVISKTTKNVNFASLLQTRKETDTVTSAISAGAGKKTRKTDEPKLLVLQSAYSSAQFNPNAFFSTKLSLVANQNTKIRSSIEQGAVRSDTSSAVKSRVTKASSTETPTSSKVQIPEAALKANVGDSNKVMPQQSQQQVKNPVLAAKTAQTAVDQVVKPVQNQSQTQAQNQNQNQIADEKSSDNSVEPVKKLKNNDKAVTASEHNQKTSVNNSENQASAQNTPPAEKAQARSSELKSVASSEGKTSKDHETVFNQVQEKLPEVAQANRLESNNVIFHSDKVARPESESVTTQVSTAISTAYNRPGQHITVNLNPPELGKVTIRFQKDGDMVNGTIEVERVQTKDQIQAALPRMLQNTQDSGIQLKQIEVILQEQSRSELSFNNSADQQTKSFSDHHQPHASNAHLPSDASDDTAVAKNSESSHQQLHASDKSLNILA